MRFNNTDLNTYRIASSTESQAAGKAGGNEESNASSAEDGLSALKFRGTDLNGESKVKEKRMEESKKWSRARSKIERRG